MIDKKKNLENHFPVTSPLRAWTQVNTEQSTIMTWIKTSAIQMSLLLQMQRISPSIAINRHRLTSHSPTNCDICLQYVFVFLPSLTTVQFSWQRGLAYCFFLERGGVWLFWQHRLPYHLIVSSKLWCSPAQRAWAAAAVPGGTEWGWHHTTPCTHMQPTLTAGAMTTSTGPQRQDPSPWSHHSWAMLIHGFCWHSKGRGFVHLMSYSRRLSQKHRGWKNQTP